MELALDAETKTACLAELDPSRSYSDAFDTDFTEQLAKLAKANAGDYFDLILSSYISDEERQNPRNSIDDALGRFYDGQKWGYFRDIDYDDLVKLVLNKNTPLPLTRHPWVEATYIDTDSWSHRIRFTKNSEQEERVEVSAAESDPVQAEVSFLFYYKEKLRYRRDGTTLEAAIAELLKRGREGDYLCVKIDFGAAGRTLFENRLKEKLLDSLAGGLEKAWVGDNQSLFERIHISGAAIPGYPDLLYWYCHEADGSQLSFIIKEDQYWLDGRN